MAALTTKVSRNYYGISDGSSDRTALYSVKGVTTNDTFDCAADFNNVKSAYFVPTTGAAANAAPAISASTVLTFGAASLVNDAGVLLVVGVSV